MNFLKSLFGSMIENENKTKPFYQNKTKEERMDWFLRTRPWHRVDSRLIHALVDKFGDDPMFEVFVFASKELNLVSRYEKLPVQEINDNKLICMAVSAMLCRSGNEYVRLILHDYQDNFKKTEKYYQLALDTLDTAIILDESQTAAYLGIAAIQLFFNKTEAAKKAALKGLEQINRYKIKGDDIVLKRHKPDMWASLQEEESKFKLILKKLS